LKKLLIKSPTVSDAISLACKLFNCSPEDLEWNIKRRKWGFFILGGWVEIEFGLKKKSVSKQKKKLIEYTFEFVKVEENKWKFKTDAPFGIALKYLVARGIEPSPEWVKEAKQVLEETGEVELEVNVESSEYSFEVEFAEDLMSATARFIPPKGVGTKWPSLSEAVEYLSNLGLDRGLILEDRVESLISLEKEVEVVAEGVPPKEGKDAEIIWKVDFEAERRGEILIVEEEQVLGVIVPPVEGEPGKNVKGESVAPPPVRDIEIPSDLEGVEVVELEIKAARQGYCELVNGFPIVKETMIFEKLSEDIDVKGIVYVKGDVTFCKVKVDGNLLIGGIAEKVEFDVTGKIVVKGGIVGKEETTINSHALYAKFIQDADVWAEREIIVSEYVRGGDIATDGRFICEAGKGQVITKVRACLLARAKIWGSEGEVKYEVEVGYPMKLKREFERIEKEAEEVNKIAEEKNKEFAVLKKKFQLGELEADEYEKYMNLKTEVEEWERKVKEMAAKLEELLIKLEGADDEFLHKARIDIVDTAYPGGFFKVRHEIYPVKSALKATTLALEEAQLKFLPLAYNVDVLSD